MTTEEDERRKFAYNEYCRQQEEMWRAQNRAREAAEKEQRRINEHYKEQLDRQQAEQRKVFANTYASSSLKSTSVATEWIARPSFYSNDRDPQRVANLGAIRLFVKAWVLLVLVIIGWAIFSSRHELMRIGKIAFENPRHTATGHLVVAPVVTSAHVRERDFTTICQRMAQAYAASTNKLAKMDGIIDDGTREAVKAANSENRASFVSGFQTVYGDYVRFIVGNCELFATGHPPKSLLAGAERRARAVSLYLEKQRTR